MLLSGKKRKEQERKRLLAFERQKGKVIKVLNDDQKAYYDKCSQEERDFIVRNYYRQKAKVDKAFIDKLDLMSDLVERVQLDLPITFVKEFALLAAEKEVRRQLARRQETRDKLILKQNGAEAKQVYFTYDEVLNKFEKILYDLKTNKEAVKGKCPGTYGRVVAIVRGAKKVRTLSEGT